LQPVLVSEQLVYFLVHCLSQTVALYSHKVV